MNTFDRICACDYMKLLIKKREETFRETIERSLTPFPAPICETVHGYDYQIVAGFFNLFFIHLVYYCPLTDTYLWYGFHRDDNQLRYDADFPTDVPTFTTFDEAEEHIYNALKGAYEK